jgi:aminoglycoside phosphotransferase (APT) family kinase protein
MDPAVFSELQTLCQRSFPERLDQRISQIETLEGEHGLTRRWTLSWRSGRRTEVERLILRCYAGSRTWWAMKDRDRAQREWAVMRWLYGEGLPVPRVYASGSGGDDNWILMAHVSGRRLADTEGKTALDEATVRDLSSLLARLHRLTPPDSVRQALPLAGVEEQLARLLEVASQCANDGLEEAVNELLTKEAEVRPSCVLHGDPVSADVLCDARGITAFPNWEHSALGDPRWDVARAVNGLRAHQASEWVERFCAAYEDASRQPLSDMDFWEALAATQNWATATWRRADGDHQSAASGALLGQLSTWKECAWRALTRLRYTNGWMP